jgi:hypothetical protein
MNYGSEPGTTTKEETQALTMFERKIERKIRVYGPVKEGSRWRTRTNKEKKDILQKTDNVKFIKSLRLRWYGHVKRM